MLFENSDPEIGLHLQYYLLAHSLPPSDRTSFFQDVVDIAVSILEHKVRIIDLKSRNAAIITPESHVNQKEIDDFNNLQTGIHRERLRQYIKMSDKSYPRFEFSSYIKQRSFVTGKLRSSIGRTLHIAARQALHHPEIDVSWERCLHALNETKGADDLLVEEDDFDTLSQFNNTTNEGRKRERRNTVSRSSFIELRRSHKALLPFLAAIDVIWCRRYLPSHPLHPWSGPDRSARQDFRPRHSAMDHPDDLDIARATIAYAKWFQEWGSATGSKKGQDKMFDGLDVPQIVYNGRPAVVIGMPLLNRWGRTPDTIRVTDPISGTGYVTSSASYGPPRDWKDLDFQTKAEGSILPLILPPLPQKLVDALRRYDKK